MEARTQDLRPRTQKKSKAKDQRNNAKVTSKTKKSLLQKFINFLVTSSLLKKKVFAPKFRKISGKFKRSLAKWMFFSSLFFKTEQNWSWPWPIFNKPKHSAVLKPRIRHFRDLQASRPSTWPLRPRTSNCVLEDVLTVKDILENSISHKKTFCHIFFTMNFNKPPKNNIKIYLRDKRKFNSKEFCCQLESNLQAFHPQINNAVPENFTQLIAQFVVLIENTTKSTCQQRTCHKNSENYCRSLGLKKIF